MKKQIKLILYSLLFVIASCSENKINEESQFYSVNVEDVTNNILRKTINFNTLEDCTCYIEYWKNDDCSDLRQSKIGNFSKRHSIPLIIMEDNTDYNFRIKTNSSKVKTSNVYKFKTSKLSKEVKEHFLINTLEDKYNFKGFILFSNSSTGYHFIINHKGNIVWYQKFSPTPGFSSSYNKETQKITFMNGKGSNSFCQTNINCIDLYGNTYMNFTSNQFGDALIHHDIIQLKNGNWMYINFIDKIFDFTPLNYNEKLTVRGDGIMIINELGKKVWSWQCFDYSNPLDDPDILSEKGISPFIPVKDDWLHANSLVEDKNGDFLISFNRISQFWKINHLTGDVIYKLGLNGNIRIDERAIPSYIHSLSILDNGNIMIFENGASDRKYSRILVYEVDEEKKSAKLSSEIILPLHLKSSNQGSVYFFDNNYYLVNSTNTRYTSILNNNGEIVWQIRLGFNSFRATYIDEI